MHLHRSNQSSHLDTNPNTKDNLSSQVLIHTYLQIASKVLQIMARATNAEFIILWQLLFKMNCCSSTVAQTLHFIFLFASWYLFIFQFYFIFSHNDMKLFLILKLRFSGNHFKSTSIKKRKEKKRKRKTKKKRTSINSIVQ